MTESFGSRLKHAWNVFLNRDPTRLYPDAGVSYSYRPDRPRFTGGNERSIVTAVYNRIALDAAAISIQHIRTDSNGRFLEIIPSGINSCLTSSANIDQTGRAFVQDVVMSMFDEGCVAIAPVDTTFDPEVTGSYDIQSMRTGKVLEWYPAHVRIRIYNDKTGQKEDVLVPKKTVAIVENPLYAVINEPNSTMQRLIRKLCLLDAVDEQSGSGKLDLIIQLPYIIKTDARRKQAEDRRKEIERQLEGSKYGIAYTDGTERVTQLNRAVENNLMSQIEYLTKLLFSQLGLTQEILDGTADEKTMLNYYNRTIEPILSAIVDEMKRKFLTKTARSQQQSIAFFRDPFKLVPVADLSEIADKFTRNEIMSSNEIRQIIGMKPSEDPEADALRNKNLPVPEGEPADVSEEETGLTQEDYDTALQDLDDLDAQLDDLESKLDEDEEKLQHYASPYYDPVKAHEYYMRTRELKGRKSTAGLNDKGKSAARYVKEQLDAERKGKVQSHKEWTDSRVEGAKQDRDAKVASVKESTDSQIESLREQKKNQIAAHKQIMQGKIDRLRNSLKSMDKEAKAHQKDRIYGMIDSLREDNRQERARLQEEFKASSTALRTTQKETRADLQEAYKSTSSAMRTEHQEEKTRLRDEYDAKYEQELDKIRGDSSFRRTSKSKKK